MFRLGFFRLDGLFDLHVVEFLGIEDFATLQALDKFCIIMPGHNTNSWMFASRCHGFSSIGSDRSHPQSIPHQSRIGGVVTSLHTGNGVRSPTTMQVYTLETITEAKVAGFALMEPEIAQHFRTG